MEIYENHPPEDVSVTALAVFGLLKASAILKNVGDQTEALIPPITKCLVLQDELNFEEEVDTERISKIVEKSLSSEGSSVVQVYFVVPLILSANMFTIIMFISQTACVRGLLYVTEDPNNAVVATTNATIAKYILNCLQNISRYM